MTLIEVISIKNTQLKLFFFFFFFKDYHYLIIITCTYPPPPKMLVLNDQTRVDKTNKSSDETIIPIITIDKLGLNTCINYQI